MKKSINQYEFTEAFRSIRPENFSYAGIEALFGYLEDYEASTGEEMELDVIAICCDFTEYENLEEFRQNYGNEYETFSDIEDRTTVIRIDTSEDANGIEDGSFIVYNF